MLRTFPVQHLNEITMRQILHLLETQMASDLRISTEAIVWVFLQCFYRNHFCIQRFCERYLARLQPSQYYLSGRIRREGMCVENLLYVCVRDCLVHCFRHKLTVIAIILKEKFGRELRLQKVYKITVCRFQFVPFFPAIFGFAVTFCYSCCTRICVVLRCKTIIPLLFVHYTQSLRHTCLPFREIITSQSGISVVPKHDLSCRLAAYYIQI